MSVFLHKCVNAGLMDTTDKAVRFRLQTAFRLRSPEALAVVEGIRDGLPATRLLAGQNVETALLELQALRSCGTEADIERMQYWELQQQLQSRGKSTMGTKAVLRERLLALHKATQSQPTEAEGAEVGKHTGPQSDGASSQPTAARGAESGKHTGKCRVQPGSPTAGRVRRELLQGRWGPALEGYKPEDDDFDSDLDDDSESGSGNNSDGGDSAWSMLPAVPSSATLPAATAALPATPSTELLAATAALPATPSTELLAVTAALPATSWTELPAATAALPATPSNGLMKALHGTPTKPPSERRAVDFVDEPPYPKRRRAPEDHVTWASPVVQLTPIPNWATRLNTIFEAPGSVPQSINDWRWLAAERRRFHTGVLEADKKSLMKRLKMDVSMTPERDAVIDAGVDAINRNAVLPSSFDQLLKLSLTNHSAVATEVLAKLRPW